MKLCAPAAFRPHSSTPPSTLSSTAGLSSSAGLYEHDFGLDGPIPADPLLPELIPDPASDRGSQPSPGEPSPVTGEVPNEAHDIAFREALLDYSRRLPADSHGLGRTSVPPVEDVQQKGGGLASGAPSLPPQSPSTYPRRLQPPASDFASDLAESIPHLSPVQLDYRRFRPVTQKSLLQRTFRGPPLSRSSSRHGLNSEAEEYRRLEENRAKFQEIVDRCFDSAQTPGEVDQFEFLPITKKLCGLPEYCNLALFLCILRYERVIHAKRKSGASLDSPLLGGDGADGEEDASDAERRQSASNSQQSTDSHVSMMTGSLSHTDIPGSNQTSRSNSESSDSPGNGRMEGGRSDEEEGQEEDGGDLTSNSTFASGQVSASATHLRSAGSSSPIISVLSPHITPRARLSDQSRERVFQKLSSVLEDSEEFTTSVRNRHVMGSSSAAGQDQQMPELLISPELPDSGSTSSSSSSSSSGLRLRSLLEAAATPVTARRTLGQSPGQELRSVGLSTEEPIGISPVSPPRSFSPSPLPSVGDGETAPDPSHPSRIVGGDPAESLLSEQRRSLTLSDLLSRDTTIQSISTPRALQDLGGGSTSGSTTTDSDRDEIARLHSAESSRKTEGRGGLEVPLAVPAISPIPETGPRALVGGSSSAPGSAPTAAAAMEEMDISASPPLDPLAPVSETVQQPVLSRESSPPASAAAPPAPVSPSTSTSTSSPVSSTYSSPAIRSRRLEQNEAAREILSDLLDPIGEELSEMEELKWTEIQLQHGRVRKSVFQEFFRRKIEPFVHQLWSHDRFRTPEALSLGARLDAKRRAGPDADLSGLIPPAIERSRFGRKKRQTQPKRTTSTTAKRGRRKRKARPTSGWRDAAADEDSDVDLTSAAEDGMEQHEDLLLSGEEEEDGGDLLMAEGGTADHLTHKLLASTMLFLILCHDRSGQKLQRTDFQPVLQQIITQHPSLQFLAATPEFQSVYAQTVVSRIFYTLDTVGDNSIALPELQRSDFLETLYLLQIELDDINRIYDYFSYQHFYVIYCEFWSLDTDHDGLIDHNDLLRYEEGSLSERVIERVLAGHGRPLLSGQSGKFCYEDFVTFFLAEMDKTNDAALLYWWRVLDLDGDGILSAWELEYFYSEQRRRLKEAGVMEDPVTGDPPSFADILCQLTDMVNPESLRKARLPHAKPFPVTFSRMDLRRSKMTSAFCNILFNLNKFLLLESAHSSEIRARQAQPHLTEWDRFAKAAYEALT